MATRVDMERLAHLRRSMRHRSFDIVEACDYEVKLRIAIVKALAMGTRERPSSRILDIGSGGGYFVAVCRHLGHDARGTEVPFGPRGTPKTGQSWTPENRPV
jgi:protein-L-isoaspartate O-methyltransferase